MALASDYYEVLGIPRGADPETIHRAYRRLAQRWHPDRNPHDPRASEMFRRLNEAYHVLADPAQRRTYDAKFSWAVSTRADVEARVTLGLRDAYRGTTLRFSVPHAMVCLDCGGLGHRPEGVPVTCPRCHGSGFEEARSLYRTEVQSVCPSCGGRGGRTDRSHEGPCPTCRGLGMVLGETSIEVKVPPGVDEGMRLRVRGQGRPLLRGGRGDLYLVVHLRPGPWQRDGQNLTVPVDVPAQTLRVGGRIPVALPDETVWVTIPGGAEEGSRILLKGRGFPAFAGRPPGDLVLTLHRRDDGSQGPVTGP